MEGEGERKGGGGRERERAYSCALGDDSSSSILHSSQHVHHC